VYVESIATYFNLFSFGIKILNTIAISRYRFVTSLHSAALAMRIPVSIPKFLEEGRV
jgi:hypothetical protein